MRALPIGYPWIDMILDGKKTREIRRSRTNIRGTAGLIAGRSGAVMVVCDVVDYPFEVSARCPADAVDEARARLAPLLAY